MMIIWTKKLLVVLKNNLSLQMVAAEQNCHSKVFILLRNFKKIGEIQSCFICWLTVLSLACSRRRSRIKDLVLWKHKYTKCRSDFQIWVQAFFQDILATLKEFMHECWQNLVIILKFQTGHGSLKYQTASLVKLVVIENWHEHYGQTHRGSVSLSRRYKV